MVEQFQFFLDKANIEFDKDLELKVGQKLRAKGKTIAVAESMTGGLISARLTNLPGSSKFFVGGAVCYHVRAKVIQTGIDPKTIADYGLVSEQTAIGLARGFRQRMHSDLALGLTGVAGPEPHDGKPAGTVYIALADGEKEKVQHFDLEGSRSEIRNQATILALKMVSQYFDKDSAKEK